MPRKYIKVADRVAMMAAGTEPHLAEALEERTRRNEETMARIMSSFNASGEEDSWYVKVYRVLGNNRERFGEAYLFTIAPDELPIEDRLRDIHGSGRYRGRAYQNGKMMASFEIDIEALIEPVRYQPPSADLPKSGEATSFAQQLEQSNLRMMEMIEKRFAAVAPIAAPPVDPMAQMTQFVGLFTAMKGLMPEPPAQNMDLILKGIELARDFGASGETGLMDIIKEVVKSPMIENALAGMATARPGGLAIAAPAAPHLAPAVAPPPMLPANPTPIMPAAGPNHQAMGQNDVNQFVAQQLNTLVALAAAGTDPALIAENVYDNLPDATLEYIVTSPTIIAELTQMNSLVGNHVTWFQHLLDAVKRIDNEVQNEAPGPGDGNVSDIGGAARDGGNPPGNAEHHPPVQNQPANKGAIGKARPKAAA